MQDHLTSPLPLLRRAPTHRELERNLALRVEPGEGAESFRVSGRGTLHLGILIENMRREGYEFEIGPPKVGTCGIVGWLWGFVLQAARCAAACMKQHGKGHV